MPMAMGAVQVENYTSTFQMQVVKSTIVFIPVACDLFIPDSSTVPRYILVRENMPVRGLGVDSYTSEITHSHDSTRAKTSQFLYCI
jgi:hypothetical protein